MKQRTPKIITRVCITETLRLIDPGKSETYGCRQLGAYSSVSVAICRLNKLSGFLEYEIESPDNGATYTVTRNFKKKAS